MADHGHGHGSSQSHDNPAAHTDNPAMVFMVFLALAVGAILTIGVSMWDMGDQAIFIHMAISTVQVCLVGYFWMHLKRSDKLTWLVAASAFFFMAILFALPLGDFLTRHRGGL